MTFSRVLLLLVLVPLVELFLLVRLGQLVGLWPTVAFVLLTGFLGIGLARAAGLRVVMQFQAQLASGRLPGQALFDGISVLAGGALLVLPGVVTDVVGLALLFPPTRRWMQRRMRRRLEHGIKQGTVRVVTFGGFPPSGYGAPSVTREIDRRDLDPRHGIEVPPDDG